MTTYRIDTPSFSGCVSVAHNAVVQSAPLLAWACGKDWEDVRAYIQNRGWQIIPLCDDDDDSRTKWIEFQGSVYTFKWDGDTVVRITEHPNGEEPRDLAWSELPEILKKLI